jgi:FHS family L-fucose permease-like MFS transporter
VVLVLLASVIARLQAARCWQLAGAAGSAARSARSHSLWRHRNLVFGIPAIFIYLIAEIGVSQPLHQFHLRSRRSATSLTMLRRPTICSCCGAGMMVGRFVGSAAHAQGRRRRRSWPCASLLAFVVMIVTVATFTHRCARDVER